MIVPTVNNHVTATADLLPQRHHHRESTQESPSFKMAHHQMRPSGMHFAHFPHFSTHAATDGVDRDTDSTSSDGDFSDDSTTTSTVITALPPNTMGEENSTWEDRAVAMERTVVSDLLGGSARESLHTGGRWAYTSERRPRHRNDTSWIKT